VHTDEESGQTIISGMGELHLEIIVDRMKREFKVEANVGQAAGGLPRDDPQEASKSKASSRSSRAVGPVRPRGRTSSRPSRQGFVFENEIVGGVSRGIHPGGREGHQGSARERRARRLPGGRRQGHAVDGSYHDVDSNEMAFKIAGSMASRKVSQGQSVLLEPIMKVEVVTPEDYMGDVIGDLNSPSRPDQGMEAARRRRSSRAMVPLAEMFGYATKLRSMTQGRAATRWSSRTTRKCRRTSPKRSSSKK
jgi:elongation factor G